MTTVSQILTRAGQALGYTGRGEVLSAADANDGLAAFNAMLDSWSGEGLASYANQTISTVLTIGTQSYTIGSGGVINTTRPDNIVQAWIRDFSNLDFPVTIVPQDKWNEIVMKGNTSQIPQVLFYDPQYPLGIVYVFPVPLIGYTLFFNAILQQSTFSSLPMSMSSPPGYERAYILNLALEMVSAGFPCMLNDKDYLRLVDNASQAKANIKRKNIKEVIAEYDSAMLGAGVPYNIYNDAP
jgi:hypothetical protein